MAEHNKYNIVFLDLLVNEWLNIISTILFFLDLLVNEWLNIISIILFFLIYW